MTERFEFLGTAIRDTLENEEISCNKDGFQDVCDRLNEQDETINELKAELMIRKPLYSHRELEEDNERLHKRYDFLHERYAMLLLKCKDLEDQLYGDFE